MFTIRPAEVADRDFLWEMLYQALHVRPGDLPLPRTVVREPDIAHYLTDFGARDGDDARVAFDHGDVPIGAAWVRLMPAGDPGYGFVAEHIPELSMAVVPEWRGRGVGTRLMIDLIARHPVVSLSVDDDNVGARRLYERLDFVSVASVGTATTMLRGLP